MWTGWVSFIGGAWLIVSGFIPGVQTDANLIATGAGLVVFGFASIPNLQGIANGLIGIWLLLSGIWFGIVAPWNFLLFGVCAAILGIWNAVGPHTDYHPRGTMHPAT